MELPNNTLFRVHVASQAASISLNTDEGLCHNTPAHLAPRPRLWHLPTMGGGVPLDGNYLSPGPDANTRSPQWSKWKLRPNTFILKGS